MDVSRSWPDLPEWQLPGRFGNSGRRHSGPKTEENEPIYTALDKSFK
jgi:hypothetical protein